METARATSISSTGALIQGLHRPIRLGEVLDVQLRGEQCQFRVIWVGKPGSRKAGELGLESVDSETSLWDVNLRRCNQFAAHG